jgi:hypothetical protein
MLAQRQRRAGMAFAGALDGVEGEEADGVCHTARIDREGG